MGCLWSGYLQHANVSVALLARGCSLIDAPTTLTIENICNSNKPPRLDFAVHAELFAEQTAPASIERLLVSVKAYDVMAAIKEMAAYLSPQAVVVFIQNGILNVKALRAILPTQTLMAVTHSHGAYSKHPYHVTYTGKGEGWLGYLAAPEKSDSAEREDTMACLQACGLVTEWSDDLTTRLWHKLAINANINPLTALLNCKNGALLKQATSIKLIEALSKETAKVLNACGITAHVDQIIELTKQVATQTAENYSSMQQDLSKRGKTEIDHINGALLDKAQAFAIKIPHHQFLVQLIQQKARALAVLQ